MCYDFTDIREGHSKSLDVGGKVVRCVHLCQRFEQKWGGSSTRKTEYSPCLCNLLPLSKCFSPELIQTKHKASLHVKV